MIVADTNLIAYFVIPGQFTAEVEALRQFDPEWIAPPSWRPELVNVLSTYCRTGALTISKAVQGFDIAERTVRTVDAPDLGRVLRLSIDSNVSGYDCLFVATARERGISLVTYDQKVIAQFSDTAKRVSDLLPP